MNTTSRLIVGGLIGTAVGYVFYSLKRSYDEEKNKDLKMKSVVVGTIAGAISYTIAVDSDVRKLCRKIDMSVDSIADATTSRISQSMVDRAVEKAAETETARICEQTAERVGRDIERKAKTLIADGVTRTMVEMKGTIKDKIISKIDHVDIEEARKEVIKAAKETAAEKFEEDLEKISDKYADSLSDVCDIYSTMSKTIRKKFEE